MKIQYTQLSQSRLQIKLGILLFVKLYELHDFFLGLCLNPAKKISSLCTYQCQC